MKTSLRGRLRQGQPLLGTLMTLDSPDVAELLVGCGYEWLFLDMEHSPLLDLRAVQRITQVINGRAYSVVRVPGNDPVWIKKVLDTGCDGLIVPHVNDAGCARDAVSAAKYPPDGRRSVGIARAQGYGASILPYLGRANEDVAVIVQAEHSDAVNAIESIVGVADVDAVFVGPFDLSGSIGRLGDVGCPEVQESVRRIRKACAAVGMPLGLYVGTAEAARSELGNGTRMIAIGADTVHLLTAAAQVLAESKQC